MKKSRLWLYTSLVITNIWFPSSVLAGEIKCVSKEESLIQKTDNSIICQDRLLDKLNLYKWKNKKLTAFILLKRYEKGLNVVTLGEYGYSGIATALTQFTLVERKFKDWTDKPDINLVNKYQIDLSNMLDILEAQSTKLIENF